MRQFKPRTAYERALDDYWRDIYPTRRERLVSGVVRLLGKVGDGITWGLGLILGLKLAHWFGWLPLS